MAVPLEPVAPGNRQPLRVFWSFHSTSHQTCCMGSRESRRFVPMRRPMKTIGAAVALKSVIFRFHARNFTQGFP
jgi:hypothetical protein